jgi:hypothetical protein
MQAMPLLLLLKYDKQNQQGKAARRPGEGGGGVIKEIKTRGNGEDTYRRRENNKGHKQKCHQSSMKQHRHTYEEQSHGT